ncbi:hypothetical protein BDK51DRAFT_34666 [Blyttiomyces helicus]|uniref:Kinesin motor domain-containing protein n=1 Tax=Blyttiomyces helicus TaxID=388810 RepID=A0A4P9W8Q0_9FUNG|nr:hypothetical protein BDK51DRAFT_34666 [Blyttiomyces helicus]|eukprot:RKO88512.1 hypothetical protein BDK51DRAFT_34666 [Blyttiomyces helicus]
MGGGASKNSEEWDDDGSTGSRSSTSLSATSSPRSALTPNDSQKTTDADLSQTSPSPLSANAPAKASDTAANNAATPPVTSHAPPNNPPAGEVPRQGGAAPAGARRRPPKPNPPGANSDVRPDPAVAAAAVASSGAPESRPVALPPAPGRDADGEPAFDQFIMRDGRAFPTFRAEGGKIYYVDWDRQPDWRTTGRFASQLPHAPTVHSPLPPSALHATAGGPESERSVVYIDSAGRTITTHLFPVTRSVRFAFDERTAQWERMSVEMEGDVPAVRALVDRVMGAVPGWRDRAGVLRALRDEDYDVGETIRVAKLTAEGHEKSMEDIASRFLHTELHPLSQHRDGDGSQRRIYASRTLQARDETIAQLRARLRTAEDLVDTRAADTTRLHDRIARLESLLTATRRDLATARDEGSRKDAALLVQGSTLATFQERVDGLRVEVEGLRTQNSAKIHDMHVTMIREKDDHIVKLRYAVGNLQVRIGRLEETGRRAFGMVRTVREAILRLKDDHRLLRTHLSNRIADLIPLVERQLRPFAAQLETLQSHLDELRSRCRSESLQRRLLSDQIAALRGNLRVIVRCRRDDRVRITGSSPVTVLGETDLALAVAAPKGGREGVGGTATVACAFRFDRGGGGEGGEEFLGSRDLVFIAGGGVEDVRVNRFRHPSPVYPCAPRRPKRLHRGPRIHGSRKSFTMLGTSSVPGVTIRAVRDLYRLAQERSHLQYKISVSCLEVYNEKVYDLLSLSDSAIETQDYRLGGDIEASMRPPPIRTTAPSADTLLALIDRAQSTRATASTKRNHPTARSHLLITIHTTSTDAGSRETRTSRLGLVDLCGSDLPPVGPTTQRLLESAAAAQSLGSLAEAIVALRAGVGGDPPLVRASALTALLRPFLNVRATLVVVLAIRVTSCSLFLLQQQR